MQKLLSLSLLACLCIILYGCPLQTQVPIDAKPHNIDTILIGKWKSEKKDNAYSIYTLTKKSKTIYALTARDVYSNGFKVEYYYAHYSKINGNIFLSLF